MKDTICTAIGIIGGVIASLFGGWDTALQTLVIFMAIDYITGLVVAGVFHASPKTKTGARWMPRLSEAKKDVISRDRPRRGASNP